MHKKLLFTLTRDDNGYPPVSFESIWVTPQEAGYMVDNIPFFVKDVTFGDIIEATENEEYLTYVKTLEESGNSLIRVVYYEGTDHEQVRSMLAQLGCSTELDSDHQLIAINIPAQASLEAVQKFLHDGFEKDEWDYEEPLLRQ
jgi:hypothetical protein